MCGFVGYFKPKDVDFSIELDKAGFEIIHRGPDMQNKSTSETYSIVFNRLSINDLIIPGISLFQFKSPGP